MKVERVFNFTALESPPCSLLRGPARLARLARLAGDQECVSLMPLEHFPSDFALNQSSVLFNELEMAEK